MTRVPASTTGSHGPRVSVCIPVRNGADYIAEALESVLAQTFGDFELLVVDNCSTDDTETIVRRYTDRRLRYIRNAKNLGLVGNANRCLHLASSEYVCLFHHDDVMLPENLARKVSVLDSHPGVGFVHSNVLVVDPKGRRVAGDIWAEDSRRDYVEPGRVVFPKFLLEMPRASSIFIGAVLARRSVYRRMGGFRDELPHCNDSEMWMRMMLFFDVACIGEPLVKYRVHGTSTSSSWGDSMSLPYLREHYEAVRLLFDRYGPDVPNRRRMWIAVSRAFASRAVDVAARELLAGNHGVGRMALKLAAAMYAPIVATPGFLRATAGSLAGRGGVRFYQRIKALGKAV